MACLHKAGGMEWPKAPTRKLKLYINDLLLLPQVPSSNQIPCSDRPLTQCKKSPLVLNVDNPFHPHQSHKENMAGKGNGRNWKKRDTGRLEGKRGRHPISLSPSCSYNPDPERGACLHLRGFSISHPLPQARALRFTPRI